MLEVIRTASAAYGLGEVTSAELLRAGSVQQNTLLVTASGRYVFRVYANRSVESIRVELGALRELADIGFPCARPLERADAGHRGELLGPEWDGRPMALFEFVAGEHCPAPAPAQQRSVVRAMASLHRHTAGEPRFHSPQRWNYTLDFCRERIEAARRASRLRSRNEKAAWLRSELERCELPDDLPKGFCHCDYDSTNLLFRGDELAALLDFDDANYTWLVLDIANALDYWCWPRGSAPALEEGRPLVEEYHWCRALTDGERQHLFDAHRYQIILDAVWFFERGEMDDFYEREKLEYLDDIGRSEYRKRLGVW